MTDTPGKPFPAISENTIVRVRLAAAISVVAFIISATIYLTMFYVRQTESVQKQEEIAANQKRLIEWAEKADRRLERIEHDLQRALSWHGPAPRNLVAVDVGDREDNP